MALVANRLNWSVVVALGLARVVARANAHVTGGVPSSATLHRKERVASS